jgi:hypothetical protein
VLAGQDKNGPWTHWKLHKKVEDVQGELIKRLKTIRTGWWWTEMCLTQSMIVESAKVNALTTIISEEGVGKNNKKALVYSQRYTKGFAFCDILGIVKCALEQKYGILSVILPDSLKDKKQRQEKLDLFRTDEAHPILLMPSNPAAEGFEELSIPEATVIVHLDLDLNIHQQRRSEDRAHCIMQTEPVNVYHIICKDTVEHALHKKYLVNGDTGEADIGHSECCAILRAEMSRNRLVAGPSQEEPLTSKHMFGSDDGYTFLHLSRLRGLPALTDRSQDPG